MHPLEDYLIPLLRPLEQEVPRLKVRSIIEPDLSTPYLMVRLRTGAWQNDSFGSDDRRFIRRMVADVQTWTEDPDGELKAAYLHEIVFQTLLKAQRNQDVIPGIGSLASLSTNSPAHRVADWATSTGTNQYANLAKGMHRYQATYAVAVKPDRKNPMTPADLLSPF